MKQAVKVAGKLAIEFSETFDLDLLRKQRRRPKNSLIPMEEMAEELEAEGRTAKEMAGLGISEPRIEKLLKSAKAKRARQAEDKQ